MARRMQLLLLTSLFLSAISGSSSDRETLEIGRPGIGIGIGVGGGGTPEASGAGGFPSQPTRKLQPSDFENILQYRAYLVIQHFKKTITCDPQNRTGSWVGPRICNNDGRGYQGFYCETPPNRVNMRAIASVDFNGFHLCAPTVRGFVDQLPDLALFHANSNSFGGTVPDLSRLQFFYELDVSNNRLNGTFPVNILARPLLANLSFVDTRYNGYIGVVPSAVFLIQTQGLFLNNNQFGGFIPANLGITPALYVTLAFNRFTGPIPSSIGLARNTLLEILFLGNQLSGCLPFQIGLLRKATVFDAGTNRLTGPIPLSFGCLRKVEQLNLARNLLYGEVPDVVCRLARYGHLANLSLSGNYFTSVGASCVGLIRRRVLDVRRNCIPGLPNQRSPGECASFLTQPKVTCTYANYIPCRLPSEGADQIDSVAEAEEAAAAADGAKDRSPKSGYTTYNALNKP